MWSHLYFVFLLRMQKIGLLIILSQGSDPLSMNDHYEKVFDAISTVHHNKNDKQVTRHLGWVPLKRRCCACAAVLADSLEAHAALEGGAVGVMNYVPRKRCVLMGYVG